ncbi:Nn.00g105070.m01.CDS01 [Neocucurbitaria sp. VM-36]
MTRTNSATKSTKASSLASEGRYPPPDNNTNQSTHAKSQTDFHISLMLNKRHTPSSSPSPSSSAHSTSSPPIMKLKPCTPPEESEQPRDGGNRERERKSSSSNVSPAASSSPLFSLDHPPSPQNQKLC